MSKLFCLISALVLFNSAIFAQQSRFDILKGNTEEILATYYDRDSAMLFAYDKAGGVVVWDVNNMAPIRRFNIVPFNIWRAETAFDLKTNTIGANKESIWVGNQLSGKYDGKNGTYSVYNRQTGAQTNQSDTTSATTFIHPLNANDAIVVYCSARPKYENGKLIYGRLTYKQGKTVLKSYNLPMLVNAIKVSSDNKLIALGYRNGVVEVHDLLTFEKQLSSVADGDKDQILQIAFLKDNRGIAYTYEFLGSESIHVHLFGEEKPKKITLDKDQRILKVEVAPSGNYLAIFNQYKLGIYDLQKESFATTKVLDSIIVKPNAVTFLTDDVLLLAGVTFADREDLYSIAAYSKAALLKVNWRTKKFSMNTNYDDLNRGFIDSKLSLLNDSTFKISGGTAKRFQHIVNNSRLSNAFTISQTYPSVGSVIDNDAKSLVNWYLNWEIADHYTLYSSTEESALDTIFVAKVKKIENFQPLKIHSAAELVLWKSDDTNPERKMLIADYKGKIAYSFQVHSLYEYTLQFSPDGKYFAYQKSAAEFVIVNTNNFQQKIVKTGLLESQYAANQLFFDRNSARIAYRSFSQTVPNSFTYMVRDLKTEKTDTLCKIGLVPYGFTLSDDFTKMAVSVPLNFADTLLFKDPIRMNEAAGYGFKNLYQPTILLIAIKTDSTLAAFKAKNNLQATQLLITKNSIIALQDDGLFYHYSLKGTPKVITQWLFGNEQVVLTDDYYYGTTKVIDRITMKTNNSQYPIGEQDRFFNQPQKIMRDFESRKIDLINLYEEAFNKRIKQYAIKEPAKSLDNLAQITVPQKVYQDFYTTDSLLKFTISAGQGVAVNRVFVKVNGYSVYGKKGIGLKPGQQEIAVQIPLDSANNDITIQAIDMNNRYLRPVTLNYFANYKRTHQKGRLFVLTAGVSKYADTTYNLKYAAKDAIDFAKVFNFKNNFDTIIIKTLTNNEVTVKNIAATLKAAGNFTRNDMVVFFLAGHGMLDDKANFYFATHDMNFKNPSAAGLSYDDMLEQLENIPSRYKMLVIDACHSGLVDRSRFDNKPSHQSADGKVSLQDQRGVTVNNTGKGTHKEEDVFLFMQKIFSNFSYDNQINILSASLGNSYALENDSLQNGLFTYAIIKGMGLAKADPSGGNRKYGEGSFISLPNLEAYLNREVKKLSNGRQTPTFTSSKNDRYIVFTEPRIALYTIDFNYKPTNIKDYKPSKETLYRQFLDRYKSK
jgi:hypothetical protein